MKIKNIILTGVAALALTSCNDYLDVDAPSKYTVDFVYSQKSEAERALNGVYSQSLVGDLYGNAYQKTFILNSDVDMAISSSSAHSHTSYQRYDCDDEGGDILKFWTAAYRLIEYANIFVQAAEASPVYYTADDDGNPTTTPDPEMLQWVGEAKCLRAMVYHDLVVMFGDVPFSFEPTNDRLTKHIIGLSYNQLLFQERMQNVFFLKEYINHTNIEQEDHAWITNADDVPKISTKTYTGYGLGTRYRFLEELSLKASFEHTARLPLSREMLGNGTTVYANLALKPENSDNYNIGFFGNIRFGKYHLLNYEIGGFYRHIKDYIHAVLSESEGMIQYDNVAGVNMKGFETELRYSYSDWLQLTTNISYQDARDQNKFKKDGKPSITYNNKVPNRPWLFSNSELTLTKHNITGDGTRLRFSYLYQYVHWFFLTWEGYGSLSTKSRIPTQNLHSATLTYSWQHQRYNLSLECNNIFDTMAFDNFKLQKPGRNILCKFRLFIQ